MTNPPIDCIREELITSTETTLGAEGNLSHPEPESCRQVKLTHPILGNDELEKLRRIDRPGLKAATLPILFPAGKGRGRPGKIVRRSVPAGRCGHCRGRHPARSSPTAA